METARPSSKSSGNAGPALRLEDQSARWGCKLWVLTFDLPGEKVNKFSEKVIGEFQDLIGQLEKKGDAIEVLVMRSGKPGMFLAGADIEMIQSAKNAEHAESMARAGQKMLDRWEDLPFPTVVALDGVTLGGGCELSLASTAIVMSNNPAAKIGLPEVLLGIIPGMGGCTRLPRKIGVAGALDMILTGKNLNGDRAAKAGLADAVFPKENFDEAVCKWAKANLDALKSGKRLAKEPKLGGMGGMMGSMLEKTPMGRSVMFKKAREGVMSKTKGHYPAPLEAIQVLQDCGATYGPKLRGAAREKALVREAQGFGKAASTPVSKNLIRLFFLTEAVKKAKGLPAGSVAQAYPVDAAAVLGAGVMGGGVAQLFAEKGIPTRMKDLNAKALELGVQAASKIFLKQVKTKRLNQREFLQKLNLIAPVTDFSGFNSTDLVVEAIVENMDIKKKVLRELEDHVRDNCVIATNTSSLSVTEMQTALSKPERFAGMHFFNPVHRMPLVEVIRGEKSSDEAVSTVFQFSKKIGKTPIVVKDAPGFLVNRLLMPYLNEATYLLTEGCPIPEVDAALLDFGMPMGPIELIDEVGVDVGEKVAQILYKGFGARMTPAPFNSKVTVEKRLGKKTGKGFYVYEGRDKRLDPEIYKILGVTPVSGAVSAEEMVDRCTLPMINEASRCLEEGIVATASEVDLGMIMGTGFPPFRGGLLRYADTIGPKELVERLRKYEKRYGARFEPAPALVARAERGQLFYPA